GKFAGGDDTLGLVSDVEQNLIAIDLDDRAFDDVAVVEELQSLLDRGQEVLSRSDVVDGDLLGGRGGRCGSHVVGCPCGWILGPLGVHACAIALKKRMDFCWMSTRARVGTPRVTLQNTREPAPLSLWITRAGCRGFALP